jgi:2-polyprenyl-6-methoxyphenol hydroxylase-like FAD-dependent oxidoreductase
VTIIRKLGLETVIRTSTTGEEGVEWVDAENRVCAAFPADKTGQTQTPTSDIEILRGRLAEIFFRRSKLVSEEVRRNGGAGVEYIFGDYLEEIEQDGDKVNVRFAKSGKRQSFDLLIGADGLQSRTRSMVWGVESEMERVNRVGMYEGFFSMPRADTDTMWRRWFHAPRRRGIMVRPDDQRDRTTVFMCVINDKDGRLADVATKEREDVKAQKELLREYFHDAGWESERIIKEMMATDDFYYDMVAQVKMDRWSKGRVVLIGDAG